MKPGSREAAFPTLTPQEMEFIRAHATAQRYADGDVVFKAGQAAIDFFVVEEGGIEIINPTADNALVTTHGPGHFAGDVDLLTRRPVIVTAIARGPTVLLRVPNADFRRVMSEVQSLGEKLVDA